MSRPMNKRGRGRRAGAEGHVAEEVEDARKAELFGEQIETSVFPARQRLDEARQARSRSIP